MKKIVIMFLFVLGLISTIRVEAQMAAATKTVWDLEVKVDVKISKGDLWRLIIDNEELINYSNQYVKSIKTKGDEGLLREIVFTNGNKRSETIVQTDYVHKFLVIKIHKESLPKELKNAEIAIFTKDIDDNNSTITWLAKIEGKKSQKKQLLDQLKSEFKSYAEGFGTIKK